MRRGLDIVEANYRSRWGEIDIIARSSDALIFVEVRSRRSDQPVHPAESVDSRKQAKLVKTAQTYLASHPELADSACRFDVAQVVFESGKPVIIEIIENAFGEA